MSFAEVVAEPVRSGLQYGEGVYIGLLLRSIGAAWREGNFHVVAGLLRSLLDGCAAAQNDQVGERDLLPVPFCAPLKSLWIASSV